MSGYLIQVVVYCKSSFNIYCQENILGLVYKSVMQRSDDDNSFSDNAPMLKSHYEVLGSNLKLFDVDEEDAGMYVCHANSTADPAGKTAETELLVIGKHGKPQKPGSSMYTRSPMVCDGI